MPDPTKKQIDAVVPGVIKAYEALILKRHHGIQTSTGSYYNHTFFGRDASMTAKFIVDIEPEAAYDVILSLARLQGVRSSRRTQEQPGRIHHEWRDFRLWRGRLIERLLLFPWTYLWGGNSRLLLTYFSVDSTASYIRLVHKYATHIDDSILGVEIRDKSGRMVTIGQSVERAANWLCDQLVQSNLVETKRSNPFSLPFQTYQDSVTAYSRTNGSLANYRSHIGYVENQGFLADSLYDAAALLPDNDSVERWNLARESAENGLFHEYWRDDRQFMAPCIDKHGPVDRDAVSAGWTLNTAVWESLPTIERREKISALVRRLFSDDFLTPVGLRSRAYAQPPILEGVTEYHGRQTVWPMFTFMVAEGLRRHGLYRLAEQLDWRMLNGLNLTGTFDEFFIVDKDSAVMIPAADKKQAERTVYVQMPVEKRIAFTVMPALITARRTVEPPKEQPQEAWQVKLEEELLGQIPLVKRHEPSDAARAFREVIPVRYSRWRGALHSTVYFLKESVRL